MAYVLEVGQFQSVKMPHTYMRRAQATLHRTVWKQIAMSNELQPLLDYAAKLETAAIGFRIVGVGEHCTIEPITV